MITSALIVKAVICWSISTGILLILTATDTVDAESMFSRR